MRTTAIALDKVNTCLSIRINEIPGVESSMAFKVHAIFSDESLGIRNDMHVFKAINLINYNVEFAVVKRLQKPMVESR